MRVKYDPMIGVLISFDPSEIDLGVDLLFTLAEICGEEESGKILNIAQEIEAKEGCHHA